jgi:hypothetical protein
MGYGKVTADKGRHGRVGNCQPPAEQIIIHIQLHQEACRMYAYSMMYSEVPPV